MKYIKCNYLAVGLKNKAGLEKVSSDAQQLFVLLEKIMNHQENL